MRRGARADAGQSRRGGVARPPRRAAPVRYGPFLDLLGPLGPVSPSGSEGGRGVVGTMLSCSQLCQVVPAPKVEAAGAPF